MSWTDYTHAKHFGNGIYRPYSDVIADIAHQLDNRMAADPPFAKTVGRLHERDTMVVYGDSVLLVSISRMSYRHYPAFNCFSWEQFYSGGESDFFGTPFLDCSVSLVDLDALRKHLISDHHFEEPLSFRLPIQVVSQTAENRVAACKVAADFIWRWEREPYDEMLLGDDFST